MYRRTALAGAGTAFALAAAGCLGERGGTTIDGDADGRPDRPATSGTGDATNGSDPSDAAAGDAETVPVLTDYAVSDEAVRPDVERPSDTDVWGVFVASRDAAVEAFGRVDGDEHETACAFLDGTAFDAGERLVYVEASAPQLCYELRLGREPRVAETGRTRLTLDVARTAPPENPCADVITAVDLLLRLSFDSGASDVVSVAVTGHRDRPEELRLEARR